MSHVVLINYLITRIIIIIREPRCNNYEYVSHVVIIIIIKSGPPGHRPESARPPEKPCRRTAERAQECLGGN